MGTSGRVLKHVLEKAEISTKQFHGYVGEGSQRREKSVFPENTHMVMN
jgi:hypothetical protein